MSKPIIAEHRANKTRGTRPARRESEGPRRSTGSDWIGRLSRFIGSNRTEQANKKSIRTLLAANDHRGVLPLCFNHIRQAHHTRTHVTRVYTSPRLRCQLHKALRGFDFVSRGFRFTARARQPRQQRFSPSEVPDTTGRKLRQRLILA